MRKKAQRKRNGNATVRAAIRIVVLIVVVALPLAASSAVLNSYAVPKMVVLLVGAASLAGLMGYLVLTERRSPIPRSRLSLVMATYALSLTIVTAFSVDPVISLEGTFASQMGLLAWLCFVACFYGVLVATRRDREFFGTLAFAVVATGGIVGLIGLGHLVYKVATDWAAVAAGDESVRLYSTIGHPDYAGNFLLFPLFLSIGLARGVAERWKRITCWATAVLAAVAVVYTGTRGAWVGGAVGVALGVVLAWRSVFRGAVAGPHVRRTVAIGAILVALGAGIVAGTDLGTSVRNRASKFYTEGYTGAGRTLIWGLSLRMVPAFWDTGCGLETFRLAQIPFKTPDFERSMKGMTAEDPHSAYLSHLVATGVVPTAFYLVLLGLAIADLVASIRNAKDRPDAALGIGLLCSLVATLVHDVFLHHMLADGLYLFVFLALSSAWRAIADGDAAPAAEGRSRSGRFARLAVAAVCVVPLIAASLYAWELVAADRSILLCMAAAKAGNDDLTRRYGGRATDAGLYQSDYHFLYGGALEQLVERRPDLDAKQRLELAASEVEIARERTLTPVHSLVAAALLNIRLGRFDAAAEELEGAEAMDPTSGMPQLGWSSFYLNRGDVRQAVERYVEARRRGVLFSRAETLDAKLRAAVQKSGDDRRALRRLLQSVGP